MPVINSRFKHFVHVSKVDSWISKGGLMLRTRGFYHKYKICIMALVLLICTYSFAVPSAAQTSKILYDQKKSSLNKDKAVGNANIGIVWGQLFQPVTSRAIERLKDGMNKYTGIETKVQKHIELASQELHDFPIIFITSKDRIELTPTERENLKKYIQRGGFLFVETKAAHQENPDLTRHNPDHGGGGPFRKLIKDVVPNARFTSIPNTDPLYHCFFSFESGPPGVQRSEYSPYLEGVYYNGRLVAVYSDKGYMSSWSGNKDSYIKLGVNMIVFAMIQEGSIAEQY